MTTLSILVGVCIWILVFYKLEAHEALTGSFEFFSVDCAKLLCSLVFVGFNAIIELHALDGGGKCSMTFLYESESGFYKQ